MGVGFSADWESLLRFFSKPKRASIGIAVECIVRRRELNFEDVWFPSGWFDSIRINAALVWQRVGVKPFDNQTPSSYCLVLPGRP